MLEMNESQKYQESIQLQQHSDDMQRGQFLSQQGLIIESDIMEVTQFSSISTNKIHEFIPNSHSSDIIERFSKALLLALLLVDLTINQLVPLFLQYFSIETFQNIFERLYQITNANQKIQECSKCPQSFEETISRISVEIVKVLLCVILTFRQSKMKSINAIQQQDCGTTTALCTEDERGKDIDENLVIEKTFKGNNTQDMTTKDTQALQITIMRRSYSQLPLIDIKQSSPKNPPGKRAFSKPLFVDKLNKSSIIIENLVKDEIQNNFPNITTGRLENFDVMHRLGSDQCFDIVGDESGQFKQPFKHQSSIAIDESRSPFQDERLLLMMGSQQSTVELPINQMMTVTQNNFHSLGIPQRVRSSRNLQRTHHKDNEEHSKEIMNLVKERRLNNQKVSINMGAKGHVFSKQYSFNPSQQRTVEINHPSAANLDLLVPQKDRLSTIMSKKSQKMNILNNYQNNLSGYQALKSNSQLNTAAAQKKKIRKLEKQLNNNKIFLNMVIHDMRNPTNSIEFAIKEIMKVLSLDNKTDQSFKQRQRLLSFSQPQHPINRSQNFKQNTPQIRARKNSSRMKVLTDVAPPVQKQSIFNLNVNNLSLSRVLSNNATPTGQFQHQVIGAQSPKKSLILNEDPIISIAGNINFRTGLQVANNSSMENNINQSILKKMTLLEEVKEGKDEDNLDKVSSNMQSSPRLDLKNISNFNGGQFCIIPHLRSISLPREKFNHPNLENDDQNEGPPSERSSEGNNQILVQDPKSSIISPLFHTMPADQSSLIKENQGIIYGRTFLNLYPSFVPIPTEQVNINFSDYNNKQKYKRYPRQSKSLYPIKKNVLSTSEEQKISKKISRGSAAEEIQDIKDFPVSQQLYAPPYNLQLINSRSNEDGYNQPINNRIIQIHIDSSIIEGKQQQQHQLNPHDRRSLPRFSIQSQTAQQMFISDKSQIPLHFNIQSQQAIPLESTTQQNAMSHSIKRVQSKLQKQLSQKSDKSRQKEYKNRIYLKSPISNINNNSGAQLCPTSPIVNLHRQNQSSLQMTNNNVSLQLVQQQLLQQKQQSSSPPTAQQQMQQNQQMMRMMISGSQQAIKQQFVLGEDERKQCEQWLKNSLFSSTMLLNLINDLLDLAKIENSQFNFNTKLFNLHDVIQKALDTLDFQAQQKCIKMDYIFEEPNAGHFLEISGDDNRYLQILLNFLSNALKFTPNNGSVRVETRLLDTQATVNKVKVAKQLSQENKKSVQSNQTGSGLIKDLPNLHKSFNIGRRGSVAPKKEGSNSSKANSNKQQVEISTLLNKTGRNNSESLSKEQLATDEESKIAAADVKNVRSCFAEDLVNLINGSGKPKTQEHYIKFEIRIVDTGQGISPENLSKLFMNFSKLEEHAEGNKTGTGLGLSICKTLIEMMGGSVRVESKVGEGTVFVMSLQTKCQVAKPKVAEGWLRKYQKKKGGVVTNALNTSPTQKYLNTGLNEDANKNGYPDDQGAPIGDFFAPMTLPPRTMFNHLTPTGSNLLSTPHQQASLNFTSSLSKNHHQPPRIVLSNLTYKKQMDILHSIQNHNIQETNNEGNNRSSSPYLQVPTSNNGLGVRKRKMSKQQKNQDNLVVMNVPIREDEQLQEHVYSMFGQQSTLKLKQMAIMENPDTCGWPSVTHQLQNNNKSYNQDCQQQSENFQNCEKVDKHRLYMMASMEQPRNSENQEENQFFNEQFAQQLMVSYDPRIRNVADQQFMFFQQHKLHSPPPMMFSALVANDDSFQLSVISTIMRNCGFEVDEAENGLVAVERNLEITRVKGSYDIIILDLDMPIMNGFEACTRLRQGDRRGDLQQLFQVQKKKSSNNQIPSPTTNQNRLPNRDYFLRQSTAQPQNTSNEFVAASIPTVNNQQADFSRVGRQFIVALSGLITENVVEKGIKCGFDDFIETPITEAKVRDIIIAKIIDRYQNQQILSEEESDYSSSDQADDSNDEVEDDASGCHEQNPPTPNPYQVNNGQHVAAGQAPLISRQRPSVLLSKNAHSELLAEVIEEGTIINQSQFSAKQGQFSRDSIIIRT